MDASTSYTRIINDKEDGWELLDRLNDLNDVNSPARSRELSLAITNIEQGLFWLSKAASIAYNATVVQEPEQ